MTPVNSVAAMIRHVAGISLLLLAGILAGDAAPLAAAPAVAALDPHEGSALSLDPPEQRAAPAIPRAAQAAPAPVDAAQSGNPLWAIPLQQLSATRERPLFSPSRRPPPPPPTYQVAAAPPPKPPEPERPQLSLVGTVAEDAGGIGVFLDATDKSVVRLKRGENHKGWTLRDVSRRAVVLTKGFTVVELALPAPDVAKRDAPQSGLAGQSLGIPVAQPGQAAQTGEAGLKGPAFPPAAAPAIVPPSPGGIAGSSAGGGFAPFALPAAARH